MLRSVGYSFVSLENLECGHDFDFGCIFVMSSMRWLYFSHIISLHSLYTIKK